MEWLLVTALIALVFMLVGMLAEDVVQERNIKRHQRWVAENKSTKA